MIAFTLGSYIGFLIIVVLLVLFYEKEIKSWKKRYSKLATDLYKEIKYRNISITKVVRLTAMLEQASLEVDKRRAFRGLPPLNNIHRWEIEAEMAKKKGE